MKSLFVRLMLASVVLVALTLVVATDASAQCSTCPVPTVAYQPVVAQPAVAYQPYTGWYPGKWLDQWRLRSAGVASAPAYAPSYYSAAYAPSYTTAYAPTYRANYAANYTAAYRRPYITAYAPLSYAAAAPCNTCTHTVARQVLLRPVVAAPACNACNYTPSCGCDACSSGVSQASYDAPYSEPGCCGGGGSVSSVLPAVPSYGSRGESSIIGSQTRQPDYNPVVPAPAKPRYDSNRPIDDGHRHDDVLPAEGAEGDRLDELDPRPATETDPSTYFYNAPGLNAPQLLNPNDRTARSKTRNFKTRSYKQTHKPSVDVWTAVYRGPTKHRSVSSTSRKQTRTQAEIDADGWVAVPRSR